MFNAPGHITAVLYHPKHVEYDFIQAARNVMLTIYTYISALFIGVGSFIQSVLPR